MVVKMKKMLLVTALLLALCVTCFVGCSKKTPDATKATEATETTADPRSPVEIALDGYMSSLSGDLSAKTSLLLENRGVSLDITPESTMDAVCKFFEDVANGGDESDLSYSDRNDANVVGIDEKFSYVRVVQAEGYKAHHWEFSAETYEESSTVKWVQLDTLRNHNGSDCMSINGVSTSMSLEETINCLGKPSEYGTKMSNGAELVFLRWDYDKISFYVCFTAESEDIAGLPVYNMYAQVEAP